MAVTLPLLIFFVITYSGPNSFSAEHNEHHINCQASHASLDPSCPQPFRLSSAYFHAFIFWYVNWGNIVDA